MLGGEKLIFLRYWCGGSQRVKNPTSGISYPIIGGNLSMVQVLAVPSGCNVKRITGSSSDCLAECSCV